MRKLISSARGSLLLASIIPTHARNRKKKEWTDKGYQKKGKSDREELKKTYFYGILEINESKMIMTLSRFGPSGVLVHFCSRGLVPTHVCVHVWLCSGIFFPEAFSAPNHTLKGGREGTFSWEWVTSSKAAQDTSSNSHIGKKMTRCHKGEFWVQELSHRRIFLAEVGLAYQSLSCIFLCQRI